MTATISTTDLKPAVACLPASGSIQPLLRPRSVAVIGASEKPGKVGTLVLANLLAAGFEGSLYPVSLHRETVQGVHAVREIGELAESVDLAMICTPAATVPELVAQCGRADVRGVIVLSAGFRETGPEGAAREEQLRNIHRQFPKMRILGPNCLGVITPAIHLNASFAGRMPQPGRTAFISQSGALCTSILDWAIEKQVGFSHFISIGNSMDVGIADIIDFLADDGSTDAILMYVESIVGARHFMSAARSFTRTKPIIVYKAGRFEQSARAVISHTGSVAGVDRAYEAAFERAGIIRVFDVDDLFDSAELLSRVPKPAGDRLAVITNAGGPGIMATDTLIAEKGQLSQLAESTVSQLATHLPAASSHGNPVDLLGDATAERYSVALEAILEDPGVDAALVILTPQAMTQPNEIAERVIDIYHRYHKPVLASWMGSGLVHDAVSLLDRSAIPNYSTPERAVRAFMTLVQYARSKKLLYEVPHEIPIVRPADVDMWRSRFRTSLDEGAEVLPAHVAKDLLNCYGISVAKAHAVHSASEAVDVAKQLGYPVAMKILSPDISHKTDVQGVRLNLENAAKVAATYEQLTADARALRPDARIVGATIERMVTDFRGVELLLGSKKDPVFGPVVAVGYGGVAVEVFQDVALGLPPLNERLARHMLESLRCWPLLQGYRGRFAADIDVLVETMLRFSYLVADFPEIREIDVNPLLATSDACVALDARVVLDPEVTGKISTPYSHLAIRPYPQDLVRRDRLNDGTEVVLRPIRPEDVPKWKQMLESCSVETTWRRFGHAMRATTDEAVARYCFPDYDREIAMVAELDDESHRLIGVGRLSADPAHRSAEMSFLVVDAWQGKGLGTLLANCCLLVARRWGLQRVSAITAVDNCRMLHIFTKCGFELDSTREPDFIWASKEVG